MSHSRVWSTMALLFLLFIPVLIVIATFVPRIVRLVLGVLHVRRTTRNVPGPPTTPLLGNFPDVAGDADDIYDKFIRISNEYGPTVTLWIGPVCFFVVMDPDDLELIMTSPKFINKSFVYTAVEPLMGLGLATLGGQTWRNHRKAITPSLHLDILTEFVKVFAAEGALFAEDLGNLADSKQVFDIRPLCGRCANRAVCRSVLTMEDISDDLDQEEFVGVLTPALELFMHRVWRPWLLSEWTFSWTRLYPEFKRIKTIMDRFVNGVLKYKIKEQDSGRPKKAVRRQAFLDHVLSSAEGAMLSQNELFNEVKTIVSIASGSSMDALAFVLYSLALRQDLQDKVREEVDDVLGDEDRQVTHSDLPHLQYLDRFIKEVMRFFTVVPVMARACPEDIKLPSGYTAPKGCQIAFFLPHTHFNPRFFPEAKKFDPDRFLPENSRGRHPFCYIPFSAGPRNCIGQRYAMMFLKTIVASVVRKVRLLPAPGGPERPEDVRLKMDLTLSPRDGANILVDRRPMA